MQSNEELVAANAETVDEKKRLACPKAFKLSKEHDISLKEIGDICNRLDIKIVSCQLGCFK
jgi:hypothetical protein